MKTLWRLLRDDRGTESAEWALILGVIVLAAIIAATTARQSMSTIFGNLNTELADAAAP